MRTLVRPPLAALLAVAAAPAAPGQSAFLVTDLKPGAGGSAPQELTVAGAEMFFAGDDGTVGRELWKTDGTGPGTTLVKDINGASFSYIEECTALGNLLIFEADDGVAGRELWRSDGTAAGTFALTSDANNGVQGLIRLGSNVLLVKDDWTYGQELWKSDGSLAGTQLVKDIRPGPNGSNPYTIATTGGALYFSANTGSTGHEPYRSDGTAAGTALITEVWSGLNPGMFADAGIGMNGVFYFTGQTTDGRELWRTDGTAAGTWMVKDIKAGPGDGWPMGYAVSGGRLFFTADDGTTGREPWVSDGTTTGTMLLRDIAPGVSSSVPTASVAGLIDVDGTLFFYADDGVSGGELWKSDGTTPGTVMVADIYPGPWDSFVSWSLNAGGVLYFSARDNVVGQELWRSDGTAAGTFSVTDLWPATWSSNPEQLTVFGTRVYFTAEDNVHGRELWAIEVCELQTALTYCTPGTTASGCQASIGASGGPSASATSGFLVDVTAVEGNKDGLFFFGTSGQQAAPWGNGTSYQCVVPPVKRSPVQPGGGTNGSCNGSFQLDFNAFITAQPAKAPPVGAAVQIQCWFRDPLNTANQTTSLSDALEFTLCP